ncbi:TonB family protein [candidate division GN15 bacterium]|nr:TonB family protein [candidate division GN15 bacterium]
MKRELTGKDMALSAAIHVAVVALTFIPLAFPGETQRLGEVVSVQLISAPPSMAEPEAAPEPIKPLEIPQAVEPEPEEIPIDAPETTEKVDIPEPEPEPEPPPKEDKAQKNLEAVQGDQQQQGAADAGEIDVDATGPGSPFAGARVDNASFDYPYWFDLAFTQMANNFRNPINTDAKLVCVVYFQVIRSGRVLDLRIERSSGVPAFDDACLAAVERSRPFNPLPREFPDEIIGITVPFTNR